jgi:hypothetical protein
MEKIVPHGIKTLINFGLATLISLTFTVAAIALPATILYVS